MGRSGGKGFEIHNSFDPKIGGWTGARRIRDREAPGSNPGPLTIFCSWVQGVDATPIPRGVVACDYRTG